MAETCSGAKGAAIRPVRGALLGLALFLGLACAHAYQAGGATTVVHREARTGYTIYVLAHDDLRILRFARDGIDQSAVRLSDPSWLQFAYTRATMAAYALRPEARRTLVVGLGGGSIPMFLRHHEPEMAIDVVEIDPAVARVAESHLGFRPDPRLRVHIADGRRFIEEASSRWDVIVLDAYGPDSVPGHLVTREFLEAVRERLAPGGLAVANVWSQRINPIYTSILRTWEAVFGEVHVVRGTASESRILIAGVGGVDVTPERLVEAAEALGERWGIHFDLAAIVRGGYVAPGAVMRGGQILRDP